jgi:hypothetical protein
MFASERSSWSSPGVEAVMEAECPPLRAGSVLKNSESTVVLESRAVLLGGCLLASREELHRYYWLIIAADW